MHQWTRILGVLLAACLAFGTAGAAVAAPPKPPVSITPVALDATTGYQPQSTCTSAAKPGATALLNLLIATWGGSSSGISRSCAVGDTSEHKEGRALDWHMSVYNASQKKKVDEALAWMTANNGEVAIRLGVMYIMWNQQIWSVYYPEMGWRTFADRGSDTQNHKDHVHISLTWDGAMKQTSWWTGTPVTTPVTNGTCLGTCKPTIARASTTDFPHVATPLPFMPAPSSFANIGGSPIVGYVLTAVPGTWMAAGATVTYQWYRSGTAISGATGTTYTIVSADLGKTLTVKVTATVGSTKTTKTAEGTAAVINTKIAGMTPTIDRDGGPGKTLTAVPGTWEPAGVSLAYQWLRNGSAIQGATQATYTMTSADAGTSITVRVTGSKSGLTSASMTSFPLVPVSGVKVTPSTASMLQGTTLALTGTVSPANATNPALTWSSSDDSVASVSATGLVTPAGAGKATITATTASGGFSDTSAVTVTGQKAVRLAGQTALDTAIEISKAGWTSSPDVVLAYGKNFPDAMAGGPLAYKLNAPMLLTLNAKAGLEQEVKDEITRLGATTVWILGGTSVMSKKIADQLAASGLRVNRLAGQTQIDTSVAIAQVVAPDHAPGVALSRADAFPDALSGVPPVARLGVPILFVKRGKGLEKVVSDYMTKAEPATAYVLGGTAVVSDKALAQAQALTASSSALRLAGQDQYDTNVAIYDYFNAQTTPDGHPVYADAGSIAIATSKNFPDALSGGAFAAKQGMPLFLVNGLATVPNAVVKQAITSTGFDTAYVFGGTGAVTDNAVNMHAAG